MSTTLSSLSEQTHSGREQIKHARFGLSAFSSQPQVWALVVLAEPIDPERAEPIDPKQLSPSSQGQEGKLPNRGTLARNFGGFVNPLSYGTVKRHRKER
jgi:hypothetical protein